MMISNYKTLVKFLEIKQCQYCILDTSENEVSFLISKDADSIIKNAMKGWRKIKEKDVYLYSLKPILHYRKKNYEVYFHFKLSCRSTLNGAWVPLERSINDTVLENAVIDVNTGLRVLAADDAVCYLLADCIYTKKFFPYEKRKTILQKLEKADKDILNEKLSKIFFKFSEKLLGMVEREEFDEIIPAYFAFARY